jgi:hypothetical protein
MSPDRMPPLVKQITTGLRYRYASLNNTHYEAAWTDSQGDCRCRHKHQMLNDAARCGLPCLALPVGMSWPSSVASRDI